jgi:hypothetical protein
VTPVRNTSPPEQLALPVEAPLSLSDLDEWIGQVEKSRWDTTHVPNEWARTGLSSLLSESVPHRLWTSKDLLVVLHRARERARA